MVNAIFKAKNHFSSTILQKYLRVFVSLNTQTALDKILKLSSYPLQSLAASPLNWLTLETRRIHLLSEAARRDASVLFRRRSGSSAVFRRNRERKRKGVLSSSDRASDRMHLESPSVWEKNDVLFTKLVRRIRPVKKENTLTSVDISKVPLVATTPTSHAQRCNSLFLPTQWEGQIWRERPTTWFFLCHCNTARQSSS